MAFISAEARARLLDAVAEAIERIGLALAALEAAYERLDEHSADRLEEELFRPVQTAYGRAQRTFAAFAERHGLPGRTFSPAPPARAGDGVGVLLDAALVAVREADDLLSNLQDSMLPVEFGDVELRAGLTEVRALLSEVPGRARELLRGLGR